MSSARCFHFVGLKVGSSHDNVHKDPANTHKRCQHTLLPLPERLSLQVLRIRVPRTQSVNPNCHSITSTHLAVYSVPRADFRMKLVVVWAVTCSGSIARLSLWTQRPPMPRVPEVQLLKSIVRTRCKPLIENPGVLYPGSYPKCDRYPNSFGTLQRLIGTQAEIIPYTCPHTSP